MASATPPLGRMLLPNRIDVSCGIPKGESQKIWSVALCEDGAELILSDRLSEDEAMADALEASREWDYPLIVRH